MPIKQLVRDSSSFPRLGKLRKGGKKRPGKNGGEIMGTDLKFFRFDSPDADAMATFTREHGTDPTSIPVYLVHPTPEEAFQFWKEDHQGGNLMHRCDGETCVLWRKPDGTMSFEPKPCPGGCSKIGTLFIILPSLKRFAYVAVETHSTHDILQLQENLNAAYALFGDLTRIPFLLSRRDRQVSYTDKNGTHKVTKSLLYLEPDQKMMEMRLLTVDRERKIAAGLLPDTRLQITSEPRRLVDKNTGEIWDEEDEDDDVIEGSHQIDPTVASTIHNLSGNVLDDKSQNLFVGWMVKRFTRHATPKNVRTSEDDLSADEKKAIIKALKERSQVYFNDFKKDMVTEAVKADQAANSPTPEATEAAPPPAPPVEAEVVEGYVIPEDQLVAA